jgi:hypothetical protein
MMGRPQETSAVQRQTGHVTMRSTDTIGILNVTVKPPGRSDRSFVGTRIGGLALLPGQRVCCRHSALRWAIALRF